ncbi:hypothetical protein LPJ61_004608 [Coemansia biformis]|uniref:HpcH/HpaI aldolase/citrate lyase domain-containing protein n=1 Tax=Coemansia biformis TaxID=1286918 RepID=A0A9W7YAG3_9FUNG|nr:hypothetical protein LPJ61_004608 [Coemansia biformis]
MDPRMRSQGGGFPSRHSGYPLTPSIQPSIQPPPPSHPSHPSHSAHPVHPIHHPPQQSGMSPPRSQQHVRYYPSPSSGQIPQQQGPPPPRQGAPLPPQGMPPSRRPSQTPSPQTSSSGNLLSRLRYKLRRRIPVFGVWLTIPSPVTARALAAQGFDWACIDMEHTPLSPALMAEMVSAVASSGTCVPIVRVPSHSPEWFKWALDAGAHGVIVPMVNTPEELLNAQRLCRYPPAGKRSMGAYFAPNVFGLRGPRAVSDYVDYVSKEILVIPQIESVEGAVNLPNMLKAGGVDAVFVGPYDLSASVRGAPDMQVQDVMAHVEQSAKEYEVPLGIYAASGAAAGAKHRDGYTMIVAANDIECLMSSAADNLDRARGEARHFR